MLSTSITHQKLHTAEQIPHNMPKATSLFTMTQAIIACKTLVDNTRNKAWEKMTGLKQRMSHILLTTVVELSQLYNYFGFGSTE